MLLCHLNIVICEITKIKIFLLKRANLLTVQDIKPRPNDRSILTQYPQLLIYFKRLHAILSLMAIKDDRKRYLWPPCCDTLEVVGMKMVQDAPTHRSRVAKHVPHVAPNRDAICCIEMLQSFGRGFKMYFIILNENGLIKLTTTVCKEIFPNTIQEFLQKTSLSIIFSISLE